MTLLVLGRSGQLATHLRQLRAEAQFWGRKQLDFEQLGEIESRVRFAKPSVIINAAAYTAVDRAEVEPALAWRVNCEAPAALARAAALLEIPLIQVSTDYVFDGTGTQPYRPNDSVRPLNAYGRSKLGGELAVSSLCPRSWIIRASWIFGETGSNFVRTILKLAEERDEVKVVADQYGRPTYAGDLARLILALADSVSSSAAPAFGTYHAGGGPVVSWHAFAEGIVLRAHAAGLVSRVPDILPVPTSEYPTAAVRPLRSVLAPSDSMQRSLTVVPDWENGLDLTLQRLRPSLIRSSNRSESGV